MTGRKARGSERRAGAERDAVTATGGEEGGEGGGGFHSWVPRSVGNSS